LDAVNNSAALCGTIAEAPQFSHLGGTNGERYYSFPLEITRLSGVADRVNVVAREAEVLALALAREERVSVAGEIRSFNNKSGRGSRLIITVFAREIALCADEDSNDVRLSGVLCKDPTLRKTPMGRQICDIILAVNRRYGRSDYLPIIAWGRTAADLAECRTGDAITLHGRIQSRKYIKTVGDSTEERTAYEISVVRLEEVRQNEVDSEVGGVVGRG